MFGSKDIGLLFENMFLTLALYMGIILDIFMEVGTVPVSSVPVLFFQ